MPVDETEAAFENEFWDHWEAGIYVEVTSGEPLFASDDKHDAGMGPLTTLCKVRFLRIADLIAWGSILNFGSKAGTDGIFTIGRCADAAGGWLPTAQTLHNREFCYILFSLWIVGKVPNSYT